MYTFNFHYILLRPDLLCHHTVIILCIVEVVIILLLIFLRKRILIAIALIKEASKSVYLLTVEQTVFSDVLLALFGFIFHIIAFFGYFNSISS